MRPLKFPALPRATLLWLAVALGSALLWFLTLRGIPPFLTGFTPFFAFGLAVALLFGLPLLFIVPRVAPSMLAAESQRLALRRLALFALGGTLTLLSFALFNEMPTTPWEVTAQPPEPMVELVTTLPMDFSFDGVYARGVSGQLYNYNRFDCHPDCAWSTREALPAPPHPDEFWSGKCYVGDWERSGLGLTPPPPRRAVMVLPTQYCGVDGSAMTYYLLIDDGALWLWKRAGLAIERTETLLLAVPLLFLIGGVAALAWASMSD